MVAGSFMVGILGGCGVLRRLQSDVMGPRIGTALEQFCKKQFYKDRFCAQQTGNRQETGDGAAGLRS